MLDAIRVLRQIGVSCYLATNQELHRARHMSETLGFANLFDGEFYSCRLGLAKPDPEYFRAIVGELKIAPNRVLFLDDHEVNVRAARTVGLHATEFAGEAGAEQHGPNRAWIFLVGRARLEPPTLGSKDTLGVSTVVHSSLKSTNYEG